MKRRGSGRSLITRQGKTSNVRSRRKLSSESHPRHLGMHVTRRAQRALLYSSHTIHESYATQLSIYLSRFSSKTGSAVPPPNRGHTPFGRSPLTAWQDAWWRPCSCAPRLCWGFHRLAHDWAARAPRLCGAFDPSCARPSLPGCDCRTPQGNQHFLEELSKPSRVCPDPDVHRHPLTTLDPLR